MRPVKCVIEVLRDKVSVSLSHTGVTVRQAKLTLIKRGSFIYQKGSEVKLQIEESEAFDHRQFTSPSECH